jgi:penicillin-binding protein 1A
MDTIVDYAKRFGVVKEMPSMLSMSLGAAETTLLDLTTGYAMLVNGGKRITPTLIDRVQDRNGKTIFRHERRPCPRCGGVEWDGEYAPVIPDIREQVADPRSTYQIVSMLHGVVQRGTGVRIRAVGKPLGGKTGTTNDSLDAWFIGFSPDLAVGVFGGFDKPRSMGKRETGSSVAVPMFRDFMAEALRDKPPIPFRIPTGIRLVRVNAKTGKRAVRGDRPVILEAFKSGTEPQLGDANRRFPSAGSAPAGRVKGLY